MVAAKQTATAGKIELADVFGRFGEAYQREHRLGPRQLKVARAIVRCRTAAMGGHCDWCSRCGFVRYVYHSCRNRHCPKCQTFAKEQWLEKRRRELLPVPYFHNVFTLPHELNPLILYSEQNQRLLLRLLFQATASTLLQFGNNNLGGKLGFTLVLHTWDQRLRPHYHLHAVVAAGALSGDGQRWLPASSRFLFPVRALSKVFRAKFLEAFSELTRAGKLKLPPQLQDLATESGRKRWTKRLSKKPWIVYSKAPFAGPEKLLDYLGRYTHRVAISNHRLISIEQDRVVFHWRDRADSDRRKTTSVPGVEFIRRFLCHVLPNGFMRIRHYGFLANRIKQQALADCRRQLSVATPAEELTTKTVTQWLLELTGEDLTRCPQCGKPLEQFELTPCHRSLPIKALTYFDTS